MGINTNEGIPVPVSNQEQERKKQIESGELKEASFGYIHSPYLLDSRFTSAPTHDAITALNLPKVVISEGEKVVDDLQIQDKVDIMLLIGRTIPELGIGATALSARKAEFRFDPYNEKVVESLTTRFPRQVAHEFNHLARSQAGQLSGTLLDALIFEGLATRYEEQWGNEYLKTPWGHALTKQELTSEWQKAKAKLDSPLNGKFREEWFFDRTGIHPRWTGYSLGLTIIDGYTKRYPKLSMREMVRLPSRDILNGSGFGEVQRRFFGLFPLR